LGESTQDSNYSVALLLLLLLVCWKSQSANALDWPTITSATIPSRHVLSSGFLRCGSDGMELASTLTPGPCSEYRRLQIGAENSSFCGAKGRLAHKRHCVMRYTNPLLSSTSSIMPFTVFSCLTRLSTNECRCPALIPQLQSQHCTTVLRLKTHGVENRRRFSTSKIGVDFRLRKQTWQTKVTTMLLLLQLCIHTVAKRNKP